MSADVSAVEQAFADLEFAPAALQELLRPVLLRALQDPALMRQLASSALSQHLEVLGRVLMSLPSEGMGPPMPALKTFLQFIVGEDVDDAEDAYDFVRTLDEPLRTRVEGGITRALRTRPTRAGQGTISLLALARLLALAFENMPFVAHVLDGGEVEAFLPTASESSVARKAVPRGRPRGVSSQLSYFLGGFVEIVAIPNKGEHSPPGGHMFVAIGRVLEITSSYVVLETLRGPGPSASGGQRLFLGMPHIVAMRLIASDIT